MTGISKILYDMAAKDKGTWEWRADEHNPKVLQYYVDAGHPEIRRDEVPWCAAFVGAILARAGLKPTGSLLARSYLKWGKGIRYEDAEPGDIVVLSRGSSSWQGHVGFFAGWENNRKVRILGGNQGNQVNISSYDVDRILDIRRAKEERTSIAQSRTAQAAGGISLAGAGSILTPLSGFSERSQEIMVLVGGVCILLALVIYRERLIKWMKGDR